MEIPPGSPKPLQTPCLWFCSPLGLSSVLTRLLMVVLTLGNPYLSLSLFCLSFSFPLENRECIKLLSQTLKACNEIIHVEWCLTHRKALTLVTEYYLSTLLSPAQQVKNPLLIHRWLTSCCALHGRQGEAALWDLVEGHSSHS